MRRKPLDRLLWLLGAVLMAAACTADYGRLTTSREVYRQFSRSEVRTDYRYYYYGGQNAPMAVMGIDAAYTLVTSVWTPLPGLTPDGLKERVDDMSDQLGVSTVNNGALLLTGDGRPFGVWYSPYTQVTIRFGSDNTVSVTPPRDADPGGDGFRRRRVE